MQQPNVRQQMRVRQTDWGDALRIDLNQLGAQLPEQETDGSTWSEETSEALRNEWSEAQNDALCDAMTEVAGKAGGDFRSFVEWTVLHNKLYDGTHMRDVRRARFGEDYRASITTLGWAHPEATLSTCIQGVAYVPKSGAAFEQVVWQPEALYETEFMALAPAVITRFGGARQIHISGVVAWDNEINPLFVGEPERQIAHVFDMIQNIFEEAGGSLADVARLRPFAHSTDVAQMIRAEMDRRWAGYAPPAVLMSDSRSFGNPPKLYTEIQVMGVLSDKESRVEHGQISLPAAIVDEDAAVIRTSRARDWELVQVSEIRATPGIGPEQEVEQVLGAIDTVLSEVSLGRDEVCLAFAYAASPEVARLFEEQAPQVVHPDAVHVLRCPIMPELADRRLKVELTARRLLEA